MPAAAGNSTCLPGETHIRSETGSPRPGPAAGATVCARTGRWPRPAREPGARVAPACLSGANPHTLQGAKRTLDGARHLLESRLGHRSVAVSVPWHCPVRVLERRACSEGAVVCVCDDRGSSQGGRALHGRWRVLLIRGHLRRYCGRLGVPR